MPDANSQSPHIASLYSEQAYRCYKRGDLKGALRLGRKAYDLKPKDPRVIWDYGSILEESGYEKEAIRVFQRLLSSKPERLICVPDGRDRKWVRSLRNDCRLMIGFCYYGLRQLAPAERWLRDYLRYLDSGTPSLYKTAIVTQTLESVENIRLVDQLVSDRQWTKAKRLIQKELRTSSDDFYLLAQLAYVEYQKKDCDSALVSIRKAIELAPCEPLVMYYHALILRCLKRPTKAISVLRDIIRKGITRIGTVETQEGIRWARSLVNDCRYDIAVCFADRKDFRSAGNWLRRHIKGRQSGIFSGYGAREVRDLQHRIQAGSDTAGER